MTKEESRDELMFKVFNVISNNTDEPVDGYSERITDFILQREKSLLDRVEELERDINKYTNADEFKKLEHKIAGMVRALKEYRNTYTQVDWETMSGCGEFLAIDNAIRIAEAK